MAIHPPMLYLGYVGMTIPFSFAVAALITGRVGEGWLLETRRATLVAWAFLTVGIILGAWWSYEVLGWGGYWAWDPVENASFIPWLTATAFLHSVVVQERRGMLRVWNLSLIIATFCLTILGTFLTRSGVLNSVHAFSESDIGAWLLAFLGLAAVTGIGLIAWRGDRLRTPGRIDSPVSREGAFLANNLLFAGFAFVVLLGTVFPLLVEALRDEKLSVGEPYFDRMTVPIGLALLFLMAVAPALPWRAASGEVLRRRLGVPAWVGALTMAACAVLGARGVAQLVAFGLGAFAVAGIVRQYALGVGATRRADPGLGWPRALRRTVAGNRRLYGGLIVHVGVVVLAVALAASMGYTTKREFRLAEGEQVTLQSHRFTYLGIDQARDRPEDDAPGPGPGRAGRQRPRGVRPGPVDLPQRPRRCGHRHAVGPHRRAARRVPDAGGVPRRGRPDHPRRAAEPAGRLAVDRRRRHGLRDGRGRLARPPGPAPQRTRPGVAVEPPPPPVPSADEALEEAPV